MDLRASRASRTPGLGTPSTSSKHSAHSQNTPPRPCPPRPHLPHLSRPQTCSISQGREGQAWGVPGQGQLEGGCQFREAGRSSGAGLVGVRYGEGPGAPPPGSGPGGGAHLQGAQ